MYKFYFFVDVAGGGTAGCTGGGAAGGADLAGAAGAGADLAGTVGAVDFTIGGGDTVSFFPEALLTTVTVVAFTV